MTARITAPQTTNSKFNSESLFNDFVCQQYLPFAQEHKRCWKHEQRNLEMHILPHLGSYRLAEISESVLNSWISTLELTGLAYGSCYRLFWQVKSILNRAVSWGVLKDDSKFRKASMACKLERRPALLNSKDIKRLIELCKAYPNQMVANAILLMLYTGAHKSEILYARWDDIDFEHAVLRCSHSTFQKSRIIPLNSEALKLITGLPRRDDSPWLFYTRTGNRMQTVTRDWYVIREQFGNTSLRLLDLRHSFTSLLIKSGITDRDLRTILGTYRPTTLDFVRAAALEKA